MDFETAFGADFREVSEGEREGRLTHVVRAQRTYRTSPENLWSAITEKQRIESWFGKISGDFKRGGRFSIEGNADGDIFACEPPHSVSVTWEFGGNKSWVTATIKDVEDGALLMIEHELPTDTESEAHWEKYGPGATDVGWEMAMLGLDGHLQLNGQSVIAAGQEWAEAEEGKSRLRSWAEAWGKAHIEDGTPMKIAMETAARTADFYTGEV
ncbi:SRPBCC domain-containing protein [uncultured Ruegeria sp.]|uniref:SRPBCC domain-containing protein n=1 Tax=uncultured Ruegeria sp. TaxID=259304 RepID=UPI002629CABB|nr:SRPBCC domain-containing protein [uncultured Ruegeria sp.]